MPCMVVVITLAVFLVKSRFFAQEIPREECWLLEAFMPLKALDQTLLHNTADMKVYHYKCYVIEGCCFRLHQDRQPTKSCASGRRLSFSHPTPPMWVKNMPS